MQTGNLFEADLRWQKQMAESELRRGVVELSPESSRVSGNRSLARHGDMGLTDVSLSATILLGRDENVSMVPDIVMAHQDEI